ncbi:MAG: glucosamine-6-phosphate deaminase [Mycoplasma sp.]
MQIKKFENETVASKYVADLIIDTIIKNPSTRLGLATGSTPVELYSFLVENHKKNNTNWSEILTFNLDEYLGVDYTSEISYHRFMREQLFNHVNINLENTFFPEENVNFEDQIKSKGGVDIQILGIGVNGHIGFNEPGSEEKSQTRIVDLAQSTIEVNGKKYFNGNLDEVPKQAISMGLDTIMQSKQIILLAFGESKIEAVEKLSKATKFDEDFPASILVNHPNVLIVIDEAASIKADL